MKIRLAFGAIVLVSFQVLATTANAQTCPVTAYPCQAVFLTDFGAAIDPPKVIPVPDPGDDAQLRPPGPSSTGSDGGDGDSGGGDGGGGDSGADS